MKITVYDSFSKRKNSTLQPTGGTEIDVVLKAPTSIENPVFLLSGNNFNISYVKAFDHYYFVNDLKSVQNGMVELDCTEDVLASYKNDIASLNAYVAYDTTSNTEVPDQRLSTKSTATYAVHGAPLRSDITDAGSYIITITGTDKVGSYAVPRSTVNKLIPDISTVFDSFIGGTTPFEAIRDSIKQLVGSGSLSDNIKDVRWVPFAIQGDQTIYPLKIGMYDLSVGGSEIQTKVSKETTQVTIPWQFSDWRNSDPYTQILVYIPFVGCVTYPASSLKGRTALNFDVALDKATGDIAIEVKADSYTIGTYGASTGVSVPVGYSGLSGGHIVNALMTGASAVAAGSVAGLVGSVLSGATPISQSVGGISSGAGAKLGHDILVYTICHDTVVAPNSISSVMGTPAGGVKTLGNLTGYIQCSNASIVANCKDSERDAINAFLNGGFYFE